mgnify:CR=1 FL=1
MDQQLTPKQALEILAQAANQFRGTRQEHEIIERLEPMAETAFRVLHEKIAQGDSRAIQLYMQYFIGLPTQKIESKIEGQLNQVQVEVIKPNVQILEEATN